QRPGLPSSHARALPAAACPPREERYEGCCGRAGSSQALAQFYLRGRPRSAKRRPAAVAPRPGERAGERGLRRSAAAVAEARSGAPGAVRPCRRALPPRLAAHLLSILVTECPAAKPQKLWA